MKKRKSQAWSMDVLLAVVIFIIAFLVIYSLLSGRIKSDVSDMKIEAEKISEKSTMENSSINLLDGEELNESKVEDLVSKDYKDLKEDIRAENDFCVYFEDEEGNLIPINGVNGIGSSEINISGVPCK